jgi:hypothetical protein
VNKHTKKLWMRPGALTCSHSVSDDPTAVAGNTAQVGYGVGAGASPIIARTLTV